MNHRDNDDKHRSSKSIRKSQQYKAKQSRVAEFGGDPRFIQLTLEIPQPDTREPEYVPEPEYDPGLFDVNLDCAQYDPFES